MINDPIESRMNFKFQIVINQCILCWQEVMLPMKLIIIKKNRIESSSQQLRNFNDSNSNASNKFKVVGWKTYEKKMKNKI